MGIWGCLSRYFVSTCLCVTMIISAAQDQNCSDQRGSVATTADQYLVDSISEGDNSTGPVPSGTEDEGSHPFESVVQAEHFYCDIVFTQ